MLITLCGTICHFKQGQDVKGWGKSSTDMSIRTCKSNFSHI